uniref:Uncharacterized protein n=1 Tax=viral metagenome TaxID=1070528 RepID=A0A6C0AVY7_9ZZZZ|tara:strand:+ start:9798 stop:10250 length:453 start_codon:yes stop_codon:yes gene_type:complete
MNIAIPLDKYTNNKYLFLEPIENTIIKDSIFHRIILSNNIICMNNINIKIELSNVLIERYYNKYKCTIDMLSQYFKNITDIEKSILSSINIEGKYKKLNIFEQLNTGSLRIFSNLDLENKVYSNFLVILKISGIWETHDEYGITFKFYTM